MNTIVAARRLSIDILGPPEVRTGDLLVPLVARKDMALLAVVALATGRTATRGRLAGLLWAESLVRVSDLVVAAPEAVARRA